MVRANSPIAAAGPPVELHLCPPTLRAARFLGAVNEIPGDLAGTCFRCAAGVVRVAPGGADGPSVLVVRPEAVEVAADDGTGPDRALPAVVVDRRFRGTHRTLLLEPPGPLRPTATVSPHAPDPGDAVRVHLPPAARRVLPAG
jgi:ABC-type Fe3+/spermidine/putrescine transport system ATPase subunit